MKALHSILIAAFVTAILCSSLLAYAGPPPEQVENQTPPEEGSSEAPSAIPGEVPETQAIAPGTIINKSNWMQYRQFFSDGEIGLWEGKWFWKMPDDVQINVGSTTIHPLPRPFVEATERYGGQTQLIRQSNGEWVLTNYVAGIPFAAPQEPNMGLKILTDVYHRIQPHLVVGFRDSGTPGSICNMDRFNDVLCWKFDYNVRQMAYNWETNVARTETGSNGAWLGQWVQIEEPEQYRYVADLVLLWQDNLRPEDNYLFFPAMRRSLRLSDASHCARLFTFADYTHDDLKAGWNGGIGDFEATLVKQMKLLSLTALTNDYGKFPDNYDMSLGWAKPSWGTWELRPVWVIDIRPIPLIAARYCYNKRIMYADKSIYLPLAEDLYDKSDELSKVMMLSPAPAEVPGYGIQTWAGGGILQLWDVKNDHALMNFTADDHNRNLTIDGAVKPQYDNIRLYQSAAGIMSLMR